MTSYTIENTSSDDLEFIYHLFDEAIAYQKSKNYPVWDGYDENVLKKDIAKKSQYKITNGTDILCVFSILYNDPIIWRERDKNDAIYLHRIVVNPVFRGQKQFDKVFNWAKTEAKAKKLEFVRMDTWADNPTIIKYYTSFGFTFLENFITPDTEELAVQYRNLNIALLEYGLDSKDSGQ